MNRSDVIPTLNRLLTVLYRSLPMYLQGAPPWIPPDGQPALDVLARVVEDQRADSQRIAAAILQQGGAIDAGQFPLEFTAIHDLSLPFLLKKAAERQRRDVEAIRQCAAALGESPPLRALAEEVHRNALGHLEALEEALRHAA